MRKLKKVVVAAVLTAASFGISGCVAALPVALMAAQFGATSFLWYKMYQGQSGQDIEIGFEQDYLAENVQREISAADSLAFWPSPMRALAMTAERAPAQLGLERVTPPATSGQLLGSAYGSADLKAMTQAERLAAMRRLADASGSDLVLGMVELGSETKTSGFFTFASATMTYRYGVFLYDRSSDTEVWSTYLLAGVPLGGTFPNPAEIEEVAGRALLDRLADLSAGNLRVSYRPEGRETVTRIAP